MGTDGGARDGSIETLLAEPRNRDSSGVPTLHQLCCKKIIDCVLNCKNALYILHFAQAHNVPTLASRADRFLVDSWRGVRGLHTAEEFQTVLGADRYAALERETEDLDRSVSRLKMTGRVVARPTDDTYLVEQAAASARRTADAAKLPTPLLAATVSSEGSSASNSTPRSFRFRFGGGAVKCALCDKSVYPAEKVAVHERTYHTDCFRCASCKCRLAVHSFEMDGEGVLLCKTHFGQAASKRGSVVGMRPSTWKPPEGGMSEIPKVPPAMSVASPPTAERMTAPKQQHPLPFTSHPGAWVAANSVRCARCTKVVYAMEMQQISSHRGLNRRDGPLHFHKQCFRCHQCNTLLRLDTWELDEQDVLLCRTHFAARQLAKEEGDQGHGGSSAEGLPQEIQGTVDVS